MATIVYYFYLTMFYTMKPKIGGFAYIVTFGLFIFGLETWDRIKATEFYTALTDFWVIQLNDSDVLTNVARGLMISLQLHIGQLLISAFLLALLYLLSAHWFDKKVRA